MQIVHFTKEHFGSLDWELPKRLAEKIEGFSPKEQKRLLEVLEKSLQSHICDLQLAILSKDPGRQVAFVVDEQLKIWEKLKAL